MTSPIQHQRLQANPNTQLRFTEFKQQKTRLRLSRYIYDAVAAPIFGMPVYKTHNQKHSCARPNQHKY